MNKLFILRPIDNLAPNPWSPWYDKAFGFIVCAKDEKEARKLAQDDGGDEITDFKYNNSPPWADIPAWTDNRYSTCEELLATNKSEIIIKDFAAA